MCSVWEARQCRWPQVLSLMRAGSQSGGNVGKCWNLLLNFCKCRKVNTIKYKPRAAHLINHVVLPADTFPLFQQHTALCTKSSRIKYFWRRQIGIQKNMTLIYSITQCEILLFCSDTQEPLFWYGETQQLSWTSTSLSKDAFDCPLWVYYTKSTYKYTIYREYQYSPPLPFSPKGDGNVGVKGASITPWD